jgi:wobble nucleotide-excising tRNase
VYSESEFYTQLDCIESVLGDAESIVTSNNRNAQDVKKEVADLQKTLCLSLTKLFIDETEILQEENSQKKTLDNIGRINDLLLKINSDLDVISREINSRKIALDYLNLVVQQILRSNSIVVRSTDNDLFELTRNGVPAKNLSDGEKTAISFAYFITSLQHDSPNAVNNTIFIDDPISSLDSNHIFAVHSLITQMKNYRQVFVSTHNYEFFHLLKESWFKNGVDKGGAYSSSAFLIEAFSSLDGSYESAIQMLPNSLRNYKSEYVYCFSVLKNFSDKKSPAFEDAYSTANILRKFMESFLGFYKPHPINWFEKVHLIVKDPVAANEIITFASECSHLQSLKRALESPRYVATSQSIIKNFLVNFQSNHRDHYDSLCDACKSSM